MEGGCTLSLGGTVATEEARAEQGPETRSTARYCFVSGTWESLWEGGMLLLPVVVVVVVMILTIMVVVMIMMTMAIIMMVMVIIIRKMMVTLANTY